MGAVLLRCLLVCVCALCVRATLPNQWTTACTTFMGSNDGACPVPKRYRAGMAIEAGRFLHIFGGTAGVVPRSDLWTYDTISEKWSLGASDWRENMTDWSLDVCDPRTNTVQPAPSIGPVVAPYTSGLLFVGGGQCGQSSGSWNSSAANNYWVYGRETQQWARTWTDVDKGRLPSTTNFTSVVHGHSLFMFGGVSTEDGSPKYSNDVWVIPQTTATGAQTPATAGAAIAAGRARLVVPSSNDRPPERCDHTAVVAGGQMLVFGGRNSQQVLDDLWAFDFGTTTWRKIEARGVGAPTKRFGHAAAVCRAAAPGMSDVVVVFGGHNGNIMLGSTVHAFSVGQETWLELEQSGDAPCKRKYSSMVCGPNGELWLFGGVDENGNVLNDLYRMF